jgi:hypothetical protein
LEHIVEFPPKKRASAHPDKFRGIVIGLDTLSIPVSDKHRHQGHREG